MKLIKKSILLLALAGGTFLSGGKAYAQQTLVDVRVDSAAILIGEQTVLHLTVTADKDKAVQPPLASSSACIPFSIGCPLSITIIWWALRMVCKWWAMTKTVRFRISTDIACCILYSLTGSTLLVISSKRRIGASLRKARAMERRCFCLPESPKPFSPIFVS